MSISKQEEDEYIHIPSWCVGMMDQIDFEMLIKEEGLTKSEGIRRALDEYFELPHIKSILQCPIKK